MDEDYCEAAYKQMLKERRNFENRQKRKVKIKERFYLNANLNDFH